MLKERFKIKIRSVHVLAVAFLFFTVYVGLAAFPQFLLNTKEVLQGQSSPRSYIRQTNDHYAGMLATDQQYPLLQNKGTYINLNGLMAKLLKQPLMNERVLLNNGHLSRVDPTSPDPEQIRQAADTIIRFHDAHTGSGGNFLFVMVSSQISKYEDLLPPGYTDTTNATADAFLELLQQSGVPCLDLREEMQKEGLRVTDAYYVTDHHWKPQTGFWAYGKMVEKLAQLGAIEPVDPFYTDPENYAFETYPDTFLGSAGKRTGIYYAGVDDSILIRPKFETDISIRIPQRELELQGPYEEISYNTDAHHDYGDPDYFQESFYSLYGWGDTQLTHWRNAQAPVQSKFLLIGESFGNIPFSLMSIPFSSCDEMDMRHFDGDFASYYASYRPDTVVVAFSVRSVLSEFTDQLYLA